MRSRDKFLPCIHTVKLRSFRKSIGSDLVSAFPVFHGCSRGCHRKWKLIIAFSASIIALHRCRQFRHCDHRRSVCVYHRIRRLQSASTVCDFLVHSIDRKFIAFTPGKLFYIVCSKDQRPSDPAVSILLCVLLVPVSRSIP